MVARRSIWRPNWRCCARGSPSWASTDLAKRRHHLLQKRVRAAEYPLLIVASLIEAAHEFVVHRGEAYRRAEFLDERVDVPLVDGVEHSLPEGAQFVVQGRDVGLLRESAAAEQWRRPRSEAIGA
jgi:hypothetical protein